MDQQYGDDYITITDEDGVDYELEVLAQCEYEGASYLALTDADAEEAEEMEISILKVVEDENGEETLETIDDEKELENAYKTLMDLVYEDEVGDSAADEEE